MLLVLAATSAYFVFYESVDEATAIELVSPVRTDPDLYNPTAAEAHRERSLGTRDPSLDAQQDLDHGLYRDPNQVPAPASVDGDAESRP